MDVNVVVVVVITIIINYYYSQPPYILITVVELWMNYLNKEVFEWVEHTHRENSANNCMQSTVNVQGQLTGDRCFLKLSFLWFGDILINDAFS